jgi:hypothetical protein
MNDNEFNVLTKQQLNHADCQQLVQFLKAQIFAVVAETTTAHEQAVFTDETWCHTPQTGLVTD